MLLIELLVARRRSGALPPRPTPEDGEQRAYGALHLTDTTSKRRRSLSNTRSRSISKWGLATGTTWTCLLCISIPTILTWERVEMWYQTSTLRKLLYVCLLPPAISLTVIQPRWNLGTQDVLNHKASNLGWDDMRIQSSVTSSETLQTSGKRQQRSKSGKDQDDESAHLVCPFQVPISSADSIKRRKSQNRKSQYRIDYVIFFTFSCRYKTLQGWWDTGMQMKNVDLYGN